MPNDTPKLYVPVNDNWTKGIPNKWRFDAAYLLSIIHWRWICWRADEFGYVRLKYSYLRKVMQRDSIQFVIQTLAERAVIHVDRQYIVGTKSRGYRLAPEYWKTHRIVCENKRVAKNLRKLKAEIERNLLPVHRNLRTRLGNLEFDRCHARELVGEMTPKPKQKRKKVLSIEDYREIIFSQIEAFSIDLQSEKPSLTSCKYGRVHTGITRLPNKLRICLRASGQSLASCDLKNSQPLFAGIVALEYHQSDQARRRLRQWQPGTNPYPRRRTTRTQSHPSPNMNPKVAQTPIFEGESACHGTSNSDLEYLQVVQAGLLYEQFIDLEQGRDRAWVKDNIFQVFFGRSRFGCPLFEPFAARFPSISQMFQDLKSGEYRRPAWLMQSRESQLFIGTIAKRLMKERPEMPLATIHDSFLTTLDHIDFVHSIALDEFRKLGLNPTFSIETYE